MMFIRWLLNILFPPQCVSCKSEGDFLCKACVAKLKKQKIRAGRPNPESPREFKYLDGVIYALDYAKNPAIKGAIEQFKYKFNQDLAHYFADLMIEKLNELKMIRGKTLCLIPVPLHRKRLNYRGFNQAKVMADQIMKKASPLNVQITPLLTRVRHTNQQAKLNRKERQRNLRNAFEMNKKFVQQTQRAENLYFLVDDVCTTGATLENCAKTLKEQGFLRIYGLVVARTFR